MSANHRSAAWASFGTAYTANSPLDAWLELSPWMLRVGGAAKEAAADQVAAAGSSTMSQHLFGGQDSSAAQAAADSAASGMALKAQVEADAVDLSSSAGRQAAPEAEVSDAFSFDGAGGTVVASEQVFVAAAPAESGSAALVSPDVDDILPDLGPGDAEDPGETVPNAPLPYATITTLSNYLNQGFWDWFGGARYRSFNIADAGGAGYNSTFIYYNYFGFSGIPGAGTDTNGLTAARRALVDDIFDYLGEVLGITFISTSSTAGHVDFFFKDNDSGAYANSVLFGSGNGAANHRYIDYSYVNVSTTWSGGTSDVNDYTYQTYIHEIFHGMGLGHQGPYNGFANFVTDTTDPNYGNNSNIYMNDSWQQSIMSYISQTENTAITADFNYVITGMASDWQALRAYYGTSAFTGNTTYGFNTNISAATSETMADLRFYADETAFSIIDDGGIDTVDFSGYSANQFINLLVASSGSTAGSISNIGGEIGNMTLAVGTIIENAVGGSGNDTIYGNNEAGNVLTGNAGDDWMYAFDGNDVLYGGTGYDRMYGYDGSDFIYGATGVDGSGDTGLNYLSGMNDNDFLRGGDGNDTLYGGNGNDELRGNAGNDLIDGDAGIDEADYFYATGAVNVNLTTGTATGADGTDTLVEIENIGGSGYNDTLTGNGSVNVIFGQSGNDTINGAGGSDTVYGGNGNDVITSNGAGAYYGGADNDTVFAGLGTAETLDGGAGVDLLDTTTWGGDYIINMITGVTNYAPESFVNFENLITGAGDDDIVGTAGANDIATNAGNDIINGGDGNDTMNGGAGMDTVNGGNGNDVFNDTQAMSASDDDVYNGGAGTDTLVHDLNWVSTVTFDLTAGYSMLSGANRDQLISIENLTVGGQATVFGSGSNNLLIVNGTGANLIEGRGGDDTIYGGGGDDTIEGGFVTDTVYGGDGDDLLRVLNGEFYDNNYGGAGTDTLDHSASTYTGITFDFELGQITGGGINGASAVLSSIEIYLDGSGDNTIISNGTSAAYYGNGGDDYMIAEIGGETMDGGAGGSDTIDLTRWSGGYAVNMITGSSNYGSELFTNFENLISGAGNDTITGGSGNTNINTGAGNDIIIDSHSSPLDTFDGGAGNDTLVSDFTWVDNVLFDMVAGTMTYLGTTYDNFSNIENLTIGGGADVTGDANANIITVLDTGPNSNNTINAGGGNDTVSSGIGNDLIDGGAGNDSIMAGDGDDTITGGGGVDTIDAGAGNDLITDANSGIGDSFDGGAGIDTLVADFTWVDTVLYDLASGWMRFPGAGGTTYDTILNIENLTVGGGADVIGSAADNVITILDTGPSSTNLIQAGAGNDMVHSGIGNDTLEGGAGNDTLNGGTGNDSMDGGLGNDTMYVDSASDITKERNGEGIDLVYSTIAATTLAAWVENLTLIGAGNQSANGNWLANVIVGQAGDNLIVGAGGYDTLYGGAGNDTLNGGGGIDSLLGGTGDDEYTVLFAADEVIEFAGEGTDLVGSFAGNFTLTDHVENLANRRSSGSQTGTGNALDNVITGIGADDNMFGLDGNDTISTFAGNDVLNGGAGDDTLLGGSGNDSLVGGLGDDSLRGGGGDDTLNGGAGLDLMAGDGGADIYLNVNNSDTLVENLNSGYDSVFATVSWTLGANFEYLELVGGGNVGTGNALNNTLVGNANANTLSGLDGADTLMGKLGNDILSAGVDAVEDRFVFDTALNAATNVDTLNDADFPEDQIMLANNVFSNLLSGGGTQIGTLGAGFYFEGNGFTGNGASDAVGIWYDLNSGGLYYNATGGVGGDSTLFASVTGASASLGNGDFTLFAPPLSAASYYEPAGDDDSLAAAGLGDVGNLEANAGYAMG